MSSSLRLSILTPERRLVMNQTVTEVLLTSSEGEIEVLPDHVPMMGTLETGVFQYKVDGKTPVVGAISSGFYEVANNEMTVLAETLELKTEIDFARAKRAQELAEKTLKESDLDKHQFKKYQLKLQRSLIRQSISDRRH